MTKQRNETNLHPNNIHRHGYDFEKLCAENPDLSTFVFENKYNTKTIDFANPKAVKVLNAVLLKSYYTVTDWDFPEENLCPPIPGRVDYIHHLNDLLNDSGIINNTRILDVGTGATCIYPILGHVLFNWSFLGSDIDASSLENSKAIINKNNFEASIELYHQEDETIILNKDFFKNTFSASMCNPPFYASQYEAVEANARKLKGLGIDKTARNFGGVQNELWYKGGEKAFLHNYLYQSSLFKNDCYWYTSLVSKKENIISMETSLKKLGAIEIKVIPMHQGNKITRIIAWTYLTNEERSKWIK